MVDDLVFSSTRHTVVPKLELGLFHDVSLAATLPLTLAYDRALELDQRDTPCTFDVPTATCVSRTSSSTLADGLLIATASYDASVRMWDATDGTLLGVVAHHPLPVMSLAFSAGGDSLFTAGDDGQVRVWDVGRSVPAGAALARVVRCRVPFALADTRLVPQPPACPP